MVLPVYLLQALASLQNRSSEPDHLASTDTPFVAENHRNWNNLEHDKCGFSLGRRIVGGSEAEVGQFPWMAAVGYVVPSRGVAFVCGGAILNRYYVLTASHCFDEHPLKTEHVLVAAGIKDKKDSFSWPGQIRNATRVILHPGYTVNPVTSRQIRNDIALIELAEPLLLNPAVSPVCLPPKKMDVKGASVFLAGWGSTELGGGGKGSSGLNYMSKVIYEEDLCDRHTGDRRHSRLLCALGTPGAGACSGDSGGPLVGRTVVNGTVKFFVLGVLSFGPTVCGVAFPDIYTRVDFYLKFVLENIKKS